MDEISLLRSRLDDTLDEAYNNSVAYLGFLNETEISFAKKHLKNQGVYFYFFGGYPLASRCYLCISPYEEIKENTYYPFASYIIKARSNAVLSHRDYLGALMSLGVKRECIGDILTLNSYSAVVFIKNDVANYILTNLTSISKEGVSVKEYAKGIVEYEPKSEELRIIVSSMRIDNIVSACAKVSRNEASELISSELVFLNYLTINKVSHQVSNGDIMSIRGFGKFKIMEQVSNTRKDRLVIRVLHYI